jgi:GNAT superfamily N-acetyltransferase
MAKLKIRDAEMIDLPILLEFEQAIVESERPNEKNIKQGNVNFYDLENLIRSTDSKVLVAELNNQLIGSGFADIRRSRDYLEDEYHSYLGFMYVKPQHRGKGINQLIIQQLIDWSKEKGLTAISLEVLEKNTPAVKSYEKVGFEKVLIEMRMNLE